MNKNKFYLLAGIVLAISTLSSLAATAAKASVATLPDGLLTFPLVHGKSTYMSLPLTSHSTYTGVVASVSTNTLRVDDSPAPFPSNLATATAPYFVKFLSGNEEGRVLLIVANTSSVLTLDTTDHASGAAVALSTTGFSVQAGDMFEVFPGDTISSIFGSGKSGSPLLVTGGKIVAMSDVVSLYTTVGTPATTYFFNTTSGYWEQYGSTANANNAIIYPYQAFLVYRRASSHDSTLILEGRVTQVAATTKVVSQGSVYTSSHYPTSIKLSQLKFSNWQTGTSSVTADTISVWNAATGKFDTFYQTPDQKWRSSTNTTTDESNYVITAGTVTTIAKRQMVAGSTSFLQSGMPYTLE